MTKSLLVTGGAGYIGSHMVRLLVQEGFRVTVLDNLARGHRDAVDRQAEFVNGDLCRPDDLAKTVIRGRFDAVLHFAALAYVGESVERPREYHRNNVVGTLNLLEAAIEAGVKRVVFSSSCAVYGVPKSFPIGEDQPREPINPYGRSKLIAEGFLSDFAAAYGLASVSLRYFNVAGCDPAGGLGERHDPETHLIPCVLLEARRVLAGGVPEETALRVYGGDFDTPDGTCVRDYVHVSDLCAGHLAALRRLLSGQVCGAESYNLGSGTGFSIRQVVEAARRVTGADIRFRTVDRRAGDPPRLVADAAKARRTLGWSPRHTDLDEIVATAWSWFRRGA